VYPASKDESRFLQGWGGKMGGEGRATTLSPSLEKARGGRGEENSSLNSPRKREKGKFPLAYFHT